MTTPPEGEGGTGVTCAAGNVGATVVVQGGPEADKHNITRPPLPRGRAHPPGGALVTPSRLGCLPPKGTPAPQLWERVYGGRVGGGVPGNPGWGGARLGGS